ncbi:MAG: hypothetical protein AB1489_36835 [Acidobacteriota bacterium]
MQSKQEQGRRRRGAALGNKNALGNQGNKNARGKKGNKGGSGAPLGNQFARKYGKPHHDLLSLYGYDSELAAWIIANAEEIDKADFTADHIIDRAYYHMAVLGITFDELIEKY